MPDQDRLYIEARKGDFIRGINKQNQYLKFDNQKDLFLYAMVLGHEIPSEFSGSRDGLFNSRDLSYEDEALIYSLVFPVLEDIEELTNKEKVYTYAQNMANTGFSIIEQKIDEISFDNLTMKLLKELDDKYEELKELNMVQTKK